MKLKQISMTSPELICWEICQREFHTDGALRDIYVLGTSIKDWQVLLDALPDRYGLDFLVDGSVQVVPRSAVKVFELRDTASVTLRIRAGGLTIVSHFFTPEEIEFDVDPREVVSQASLDELLEFVKFVGEALQKGVRLTYENDVARPFIMYEPSTNVLQYRPLPLRP